MRKFNVELINKETNEAHLLLIDSQDEKVAEEWGRRQAKAWGLGEDRSRVKVTEITPEALSALRAAKEAEEKAKAKSTRTQRISRAMKYRSPIKGEHGPPSPIKGAPGPSAWYS
jgi:hypothetical protein